MDTLITQCHNLTRQLRRILSYVGT